MKIPPARADAFLDKLGDDIHGVLLYGPDTGLVRERAQAAILKIAGTTNDPFLVADFAASELRDDPARITDEACALAFGGGRRAVRLGSATDGATKPLKMALETLSAMQGPPPSLLIVEAGELNPRSSLRKLFEGGEQTAAIACYLDQGEALERVIETALRKEGLRASPDARAWLGANLGADRGVTMGEIAKLALYCVGQKEVTLDDCRAVVGDAAVHDTEEAVFAAGGGEPGVLDTAITRAFQEGVSPIALLRAAQRHFQRLHLVSGQVAAGMPFDAAIKGLKPPVFFKAADRFRAQARNWRSGRLATALDLLTEAEIRCKSTGQPDRTICQRTLMQIANAARQARARR